MTLAGFTPIPASTSVPNRAMQKPDPCQGWYHSKEPRTSILIPGDFYKLLSFSLSNFSSNLSCTACPLHTAHICFQQAWRTAPGDQIHGALWPAHPDSQGSLPRIHPAYLLLLRHSSVFMQTRSWQAQEKHCQTSLNFNLTWDHSHTWKKRSNKY